MPLVYSTDIVTVGYRPFTTIQLQPLSLYNLPYVSVMPDNQEARTEDTAGSEEA
jgi:hypothetical protein